MIKKAFYFSFALILTSALCFAQQKSTLDYSEIQSLMQANNVDFKNLLIQKGFTQMPGSTDHYMYMFADVDYVDLQLVDNGKHRTIYISTTHPQQLEVIKNGLQHFEPKDSHGGQFYKVKEASINNVLIREAQNSKPNTSSTIEFAN